MLMLGASAWFISPPGECHDVSPMTKLRHKVLQPPEVAVGFRLRSDFCYIGYLWHTGRHVSGRETATAGHAFILHRHLRGVSILRKTEE